MRARLAAAELQVPDSVAREDTERFIAEHSGAPKLPGQGKIRTPATA